MALWDWALHGEGLPGTAHSSATKLGPVTFAMDDCPGAGPGPGPAWECALRGRQMRPLEACMSPLRAGPATPGGQG